jgi:Secretion system C-terminal sorting domain
LIPPTVPTVISILPATGPVNANWKAGEAHSIIIDENDHIFLGGKIKNGNWWRFGIMSYLPDGEIDTTFADNGFAYTSGSEEKIVSLAWDGNKIVAAGSFNIARFLTKNATPIEENHNVTTTGSFILKQNYPNPFNPSTKIEYYLPQTSKVHLTLYNILGEMVETIITRQQPAGTHTVQFDAKNLPSGTYFYRLTTKGNSITKRMVLIR